MACEPLDIDCASCCKVLLDVEQVVAGRKYSLFLQESTGVILDGATPESVHLKQGIRRLAVGVLWVERVDKATRLAVQNMVDYRPLVNRPEPHGRAEPLRALRPRWSDEGWFGRPSGLQKRHLSRRNGQIQGGRAQAKGGNNENWGNDQT